jgi:HTH-type transcriptional regulator / antitoxin HigA
MKNKIIKSENDYCEALKRFEIIFNASITSKESDEADLLSSLIGGYEDIYFPIENK